MRVENGAKTLIQGFLEFFTELKCFNPRLCSIRP